MTQPPITIASAQAQLRAGSLTAVGLVDASLAAITAQNPATNAFITVDAAGATRAARALDDERQAAIDRGPLHGIPVSIKDLIDQQGLVTTAASHVLDDRVAPADAVVVRRLTDAGAIIIGRTNLHQFALGTTSEDSAYGPVRNPHDVTRVAGGSSGGSAVAVAAGMGLASVGTDTGASVRVPAALCGVVGLKPSLGEIPTEGVIPLSTTLDHVGPLTRSVQDAAWMWQVMAGLPVQPSVTPRAMGGLRLARLGRYFDDLLDPVVRRTVDGACALLRDAGVSVTAATLGDTDRIGPSYADIVLPEAAAWHAPYLDTRAAAYLPAVHARIVHGRSVLAVAYLDALHSAARLRRQVDDLLDQCDAIVLPTLPIVAPPIGVPEIAVEPTGAALPVRAVMLRLTQLFNLTGHPAISLPIPGAGILPVGLQVVGRRNGTSDLLDVAAGIERALVERPR